jgi:3-deoxy-D-manno-octulosonic-acid transferase
MSQLLFLFFLFIASLLQGSLSFLMILAKSLVPFIKNRIDFERQNLMKESSCSFRIESKKADLCFEVSSEGELEQIKPLLDKALSEKKCVELIYSSPSVNEKCQKLADQYRDHLRILRLPLMSSFPFPFLYFQSLWFWITAPTVIFCRYDFFPTLLFLKTFNKKFILISGSSKKMNWYKYQSLKLFDVIVAATFEEQEKMRLLFENQSNKPEILFCDLRISQIEKRLQSSSETLQKRPHLSRYIRDLSQLSFNQKMIMGSFWTSDCPILKNDHLVQLVKNKKMHLLILPHKLDERTLAQLNTELIDIFGAESVNLFDIGKGQAQELSASGVLILKESGILCELYQFFKLSYVGGGYERSIHSVLEPFLAGNQVFVGPIIQRSTEIELIREYAPDEIHVLKNPESFYTILESLLMNNFVNCSRANLIESTKDSVTNIFKKLNL